MGQESYSIPISPNGRYDYQRNLFTRCIAAATIWGVPAAKLTAAAPVRTAYETAFLAAANQATQSPALIITRDTSWDVLLPVIEDILKHHILNNAAISAADKLALGINLGDSRSVSPAAAPATMPVVSLVPEEAAALHVVYADSATPAIHSKPANVAFLEIVYKFDAPPPASPADCHERINVSRSHEAIHFEPTQRGKVIYGYARWVNRNGKQGPWSGQIMAFVP